MQLMIDNFDMLGTVDYTQYLDAEMLPTVARRLNKASAMKARLVMAEGIAPRQGSRVWLKKSDGTTLFAGYVAQHPQYEYLGRMTGAAVARYTLLCASDEWLLDKKVLPQRMPYVARKAGAIVRQMTEDVAAAKFDTSGVADCDVVPAYTAEVQRAWSEQVSELARRSRAVYCAEDGAISFAPVGERTVTIDEAQKNCNRAGLAVAAQPCSLNDVTLVGGFEPRTYVKEYFEGDGLTLSFPLAASPMGTIDHTVFEDEFPGDGLNPVLWANGAGSTASVGDGMLTANGAASVQLVEMVEIAGGIVIQHGSFEFSGASGGMLGGLFDGAKCVAGFNVAKSGAQSVLQGVVNGAATGPTITTTAGHQYQLTTRVFAEQARRMGQVFHSSAHAAGAGVGGASVASDARVVLEVHDVDPTSPATMAAASTVLYDDVLKNVAGFCNYALMNGSDLHCNVAYTRMRRNGGTVVRSEFPGDGFVTRLQGALADGGECRVTTTDLYFMAAQVPAPTEQIVVTYRTGAASKAEQRDEASVAAMANGSDDGVRSCVRGLLVPEAHTAGDCANGARALLEDATQTAWSGTYAVWGDFLGATDVRPGDAVQVNAPSQEASFTAIVREVDVAVRELREDRCEYRLRFANDAAESLSLSFDTAKLKLPVVGAVSPGNWTLAPVKDAEITQVLASQVTIATHLAPPSGGGFEVRGADQGWGPDNDRNLWGRFTAQSFSVPRLSRSASFYVRQFDGATPRNYSRDAMLLRVDWPL
ncbi:hypothetical protein Acid345_4354 [Candidatus Koribacter versatilis Ellin345]|uniref:Uncharacterized protein n=1 Tax=Koribacter versatilis (strain Ellin345) TaxID=204669 RepID=Q1IIE6_KORVE|nr:hypothetical protein [Candidatus Koribacter versatilis]ABF43354.1 hypothetical protein Acid345_4354 [Candidatus Koribacter versatilis Ellin345]